MDDALLVRGFKRVGDLLGDGECLVEWNRATGNALGQVVTFDQFHHEGVHAGGFFELVDRGDVRMIQ